MDGANQYIRKGRKAGCLDPLGRTLIRIDGTLHLASRLAVFWMTGRWPRHQVDHHNLNKTDNRWANLRPCTQSQNLGNRRMQARNKTGFKGVAFSSKNRYKAQIAIDNRKVFLGCFETAEQAHAAYVAAAKKVFGEFARAS